MLEEFFDFSPRLLELDKQTMELCRPYFEKVDAIRDYNQVKMLKAFTDQKVAATHLVGTTGYGYDDAGRDKLDALFAQVVGAEDALCRPHFLSGTHALAVALFGVLRAGGHPAGRHRPPLRHPGRGHRHRRRGQGLRHPGRVRREIRRGAAAGGRRARL